MKLLALIENVPYEADNLLGIYSNITALYKAAQDYNNDDDLHIGDHRHDLYYLEYTLNSEAEDTTWFPWHKVEL